MQSNEELVASRGPRMDRQVSTWLMRRLVLLAFGVSAVMGVSASTAAAHSVDLDCPHFGFQAAAQNHYDTHPGDPDLLDEDDDGRPCEALPCPCDGDPMPPPPDPPPARTAPPAALAPASVRAAHTEEARVARVIDGNTLQVRLATGERVDVRLLGIDAPKASRPGAPTECGARDAAARMKSLAFRNRVGRILMLRTDVTYDRVDRSGRLVAYASAGGNDLGRAMISSGWAKVVKWDFLNAPLYRNAQAAAKAAGRGVWRRCGANATAT